MPHFLNRELLGASETNIFSDHTATSSVPLSDEEAELAAHLEYYGASAGEAEAAACRMFQDVPF
jgi:hypothetical protein